LDRLIRDLERDAPHLMDWFFVFVGRGPAEAELQKLLSQTELPGRIVPWSSDPGLYMAASDVLLLPSRFEGVPLIMLEALRAGIPVLASRIDAFEEYLP